MAGVAGDSHVGSTIDPVCFTSTDLRSPCFEKFGADPRPGAVLNIAIIVNKTRLDTFPAE